MSGSSDGSGPAVGGRAVLEARVRELFDRQAIVDVTHAYCRAVDRVDLAAVRACYHADAHDRHTGYAGGVDGFIDWLAHALGSFAGTSHAVTNQLIEIRGRYAFSEAYVTARHWTESPDTAPGFTAGTRYLDHWEDRGDGWRIADRTCVRDWSDAHDGLGPRSPDPRAGLVGRRAPDDPVYEARVAGSFTV